MKKIYSSPKSIVIETCPENLLNAFSSNGEVNGATGAPYIQNILEGDDALDDESSLSLVK